MLAIIPLAKLLGFGTEEIALRVGLVTLSVCITPSLELFLSMDPYTQPLTPFSLCSLQTNPRRPPQRNSWQRR